jgi:hypothetical protein
MKLSHPLDFDVLLIVENSDNILPLLSPLLPSIARWRSLTLLGDHQNSIHLPLTPEVLGPKPLEMLHILVSPPDDPDTAPTSEAIQDIRSPFLCGDNPEDKMYGGDNSFQTCIHLSRLLRSQFISPLSYTIVTLSELSVTIWTPIHDVLDFLTALPKLESFYYRGVKVDPGPTSSTPKGPLPVPYLPALHTLDIGTTCAIRPLLSNLDVPRLERLYLSDVNVSFPIHSADASHADRGDSDDEARDFSLSPWSDHATGMGLRKLIGRCQPKLRVLEMCYSDMR